MRKYICLIFMFCLLCGAVFAQTNVRNTVSYKVYNNYYGTVVPDFDTLGNPDYQGTTSDFSLHGIPGAIYDHFAAVMEGDLQVERTETYTFYFISDDGGLLFVDGELLINHDGKHGISMKTDSIKLKRGTHHLCVRYFNYNKAVKLELMFSTPTKPLFKYYSAGAQRPDFVTRQVEETYRRYKEWKGDDEVVIFPIFTDVHTSAHESYRHIGYVAEADSLFHYDFMVNLGDIGLNDPFPSKIRSYADSIILRTQREMAKFDGVFLYAAGNHDWDGGEGRHITSAQLSQWFQEPALGKADGKLHLVPGKCYCWYEIPEKKIRVILLNSMGTETIGQYYIYDKEQLQWMREVIESTPSDFGIVVMTHYMPHPIGRWPGVDAPRLVPGAVSLMYYLSEYKDKGKNILAVLAGDSHFNALTYEGGIPYFISQGYGGDMSQGQPFIYQKRALYSENDSLCCDVVAIKLSTWEIRSFRIGAGGADMDYVIARLASGDSVPGNR